MKKLIPLLAFLSVFLVNAQAFYGKGDKKFQIGSNIQNHGNGITISYDFGAGENISFGFTSAYTLNVSSHIDAHFQDRFDLKARVNANLGSVFNISERLDIYPGLSLGLKNFGGHAGARYFFTEGFGVFTELHTPLSKYESGYLSPRERLHNQFMINFGVAFNI